MSDVQQYDYELPPELIAQRPLPRRVDARLMVVDRATGEIFHAHIRDLPDLLHPHDVLVLNNTRVVPAKLVGLRTFTGGRWQGLFLSQDADGAWLLLGKSRGKLKPGDKLTLLDRSSREDIGLILVEQGDGGVWRAKPLTEESTWDVLDRIGRIPLPCYIRAGIAEEGDADHYQTVYAERPGAVAAPTAGLHFTVDLLRKLDAKGIGTAHVTLHVGLGTFRPIATANLEQHVMHSEWGEIDTATVNRLHLAHHNGGRIVAVGTTALRVLETAARSGELEPWSGETNLFVRPPYNFRACDALLTNFHLPRSTLLVLVRTFGGDELIRRAYTEAIQEAYRFYSYGDAMLIL